MPPRLKLSVPLAQLDGVSKQPVSRNLDAYKRYPATAGGPHIQFSSLCSWQGTTGSRLILRTRYA
jgi:hypothetical protein